MKKLEMREKLITYCDWCGEEITEHSHTFVTKEGEQQKDFHSYTKKCIDEYNKEELKKYRENRKKNKQS